MARKKSEDEQSDCYLISKQSEYLENSTQTGCLSYEYNKECPLEESCNYSSCFTTEAVSSTPQQSQCLYFEHNPSDLERNDMSRRITKENIVELEKRFAVTNYIKPFEKIQLASRLGISENQVKNWFVNRRAKLRRQT
jgi:hypothetical protein